MTTKKATSKASKGMRVIALLAQNIKRISVVQIRPKGNVVMVSGKNGSGKSSLIDALDWVLNGTSNIPSRPIKEGESTAKVEVLLGEGKAVEYKVRRTFTKINNGKEPYLTKLEIFGTRNETFKSPQKMLDELMGRVSFDPLEFTRLDQKKQTEALRSLLHFDVDLDMLEAEKAEAYNKRRDAGRKVDEFKALAAAQERSWNVALAEASMAENDIPAEKVDVDGLIAEMEGVSSANVERQKAIQKTEQLAAQAANLRKSAEHAYGEAARLFREADELRRLANEATQQHKADNETAEAIEREAKAILVPAEVNGAVVREKLLKSRKINDLINVRQVLANLKKSLQAAESEWDLHDSNLKAFTEQRDAAIKNAKMPVDGMSIDEQGEILFGGIPFSQASNGQQIRISVAMGIACNPTLRIMYIKDGSLLDDDTLDMIRTMADDEQYQIWIERVGNDKAIGIVMEDGVATGEEVEKV